MIVVFKEQLLRNGFEKQLSSFAVSDDGRGGGGERKRSEGGEGGKEGEVGGSREG